MEVILLELCCCCYCWAICNDDPASRRAEQKPKKKKILAVEEPVRLEVNPVAQAKRFQEAKVEQIFEPNPYGGRRFPTKLTRANFDKQSTPTSLAVSKKSGDGSEQDDPS
jgi:hypothetical protein